MEEWAGLPEIAATGPDDVDPESDDADIDARSDFDEIFAEFLVSTELGSNLGSHAAEPSTPEPSQAPVQNVLMSTRWGAYRIIPKQVSPQQPIDLAKRT